MRFQISEAYIKFLDVYIDSSKDIDTKDALVLDDGLNVVANKIKNKYAKVDENSAVLYKMGLTYFNEIGDYGAAAKYFGMVDSNDETYGELSDYYGSIALILSSTNVNANELIDKVNGFASYNTSSLTNDNRQKFENYKTVGKIYVTYLSVPGVPEQAETVMSDAVKNLNEYTGEDTADFFYSYNSDLAEIYYALAEASEEVDEGNYKLALNYYQEVNDQIQGKVSVGEEPSSDTAKALVQAYINNMCRMADIYGKLGDFDSAVATYETAEDNLGAGNSSAVKLYSEHLNYLYTSFEAKQQDPGKWTTSQKEQILEVYNAGNQLDGIDNNPNWIKRSSVMDSLDDGSLEEEEEDEEKTETDNTEESSGDDSEKEGE